MNHDRLQMNILILDSQPLQVESLTRALRISGYQVLTASTGREALEYLDRYEPRIDVIITDDAAVFSDADDLVVHLTWMDKCTPIILMTSGNLTTQTLNPLCSICATLLEKPFDMAALIRSVEQSYASSVACRRHVEPSVP
jgi:DNA-binding response OmpR family regulator